MKVHTTKFATITILSLLAFVMASSVCSAQDRSGKTEIYGIAEIYQDLTLYGVGLGYNLDNQFNLNTDLVFCQDIGEFSGSLYFWNANLDYNILEGPLTPLVSGGLGYIFGGGGGAFSYNFGVGGRYDISDNLFIKAMYKMTWIEDFDLDGILLGIGYMF